VQIVDTKNICNISGLAKACRSMLDRIKDHEEHEQNEVIEQLLSILSGNRIGWLA
jgi:hypothetical protein